MTQRTLDDLAIEIEGIGKTLLVLGSTLDPSAKDSTWSGETYESALFCIAEHCKRIQEELSEAHLRLEVKPTI